MLEPAATIVAAFAIVAGIGSFPDDTVGLFALSGTTGTVGTIVFAGACGGKHEDGAVPGCGGGVLFGVQDFSQVVVHGFQ